MIHKSVVLIDDDVGLRKIREKDAISANDLSFSLNSSTVSDDQSRILINPNAITGSKIKMLGVGDQSKKTSLSAPLSKKNIMTSHFREKILLLFPP